MNPLRAGRDPRLLAAYALYAAILIEGLMLASIGPSLDVLANQVGSTLGQIGILFTANSLGYIAGSLAAGRAYERLRGTTVLAGALIAMATLTALIPVAGSLWLLLVLLAVIGISIGLIDVGGNTLLIWLFGRDVPPHMNVLHLAFGIGAVLSPLIIDRFAAATGDAADAFFLFAALMIPTGIWLYRTPSPGQPRETLATGSFEVVRRHAWFVGALAVLFFLHVGSEVSFGGWIFSYGEETGVGAETTARILNSTFWAGLVFGRVLAIPVSQRLSPARMLQIDLVGALASLVFIEVASGWSGAIWVGTFGFGMAVASMFASCITFAGARIPTTSHVTAVFLVGGSAGSMTLPWLVGRLFESQGPEWLIYITGGAMVIGIVLFRAIAARAPDESVDVESAPTASPPEERGT